MPGNVDVDSEMRQQLWKLFAIAISTTDVRDCFHRFSGATIFREVFLPQASPGTLVLNDGGEMLEGQRLEAHPTVCPCCGLLPMGFSWSLFLVESCNEEKVCLAPSLRRVCGGTTTKSMHDRGSPLVFAAGEQGHGGAKVFVDNLGAVCDNVSEPENDLRMERDSSNFWVWLFTK